MNVDTPTGSLQRKVSFAADVKPPGPSGEPPHASTAPEVEKTKEPPRVDGLIGQLEVYRSGAVKMRLGNGIIMDVSLISILPSLTLTQYLGDWCNSAIVFTAGCPRGHTKQTFARHGRSQQAVCCLTRLGYTTPCDGVARPGRSRRNVN